jgi:hypothetical protein
VSGVDLVIFAAVLLFIGGAKVADDLQSAREWLRTQRATWADLARASGLTIIGPPRAGDPHVRARRGPLTVTITPYGAPRVVAAVVTIAGLPKGLRVSHETVRTQAVRLLGVRDLVLGDPDFDAALFLEGDPLLFRAAFDEPTRRSALRLLGSVADGEGVVDGVLRLRCTNASFPRTLDPPDFLRQALALADRLSGERVEERLAAIVRSDPESAVRARALELLRDERPAHPSTREAFLAACDDADPFVRLIGAEALGPREGHATLLALATTGTVPDEVSSRAIAALRSALPVEQARTILEASIGARRTLTATACVERLAHEGAAHADVIAWAFQQKDGVVPLVVARALGRCGTAAHVPLLRDVDRAEMAHGPLAAACRDAIAAIQQRAQGATPGQLSLASDGGEVSLTDDPRGRLELPHGTDEPGRRG